MTVAVLTNSCRRFDLCTVAVLTTVVAVFVVAVFVVAVFVVAVPTCRRYDLYPPVGPYTHNYFKRTVKQLLLDRTSVTLSQMLIDRTSVNLHDRPIVTWIIRHVLLISQQSACYRVVLFRNEIYYENNTLTNAQHPPRRHQ